MDGLVRKERILAGTLSVLLVFSCAFQQPAELECEEAVSHLVDCCPGFRPSELRCVDQGGCGSRTEPALDHAESDCLKAKSCDELVAQGYCTRAQAARGATIITDDIHSPSEQVGQKAVCP